MIRPGFERFSFLRFQAVAHVAGRDTRNGMIETHGDNLAVDSKALQATGEGPSKIMDSPRFFYLAALLEFLFHLRPSAHPSAFTRKDEYSVATVGPWRTESDTDARIRQARTRQWREVYVVRPAGFIVGLVPCVAVDVVPGQIRRLAAPLASYQKEPDQTAERYCAVGIGAVCCLPQQGNLGIVEKAITIRDDN